jgi:hypothetical protein
MFLGPSQVDLQVQETVLPMAALSAAAVLAEDPQPPPLHHNHDSLRPAGNSSSVNPSFDEIHQVSLVSVSDEDVGLFRSYIQSMTPYVDFSSVSPMHHRDPSSSAGLKLASEADIRSHLDVFILRPIWPVILAMLPDVRQYSWTLLHERFCIQGGQRCCPDIAIVMGTRGRDSEWSESVKLMLELKSPRLVSEALPVLEGLLAETDDWGKMTRQIRKYARLQLCRHQVLMDDSAAIYFYFSGDLQDDDSEIYYLLVTVPARAGGLTVRELVAFAAWNAIF